MSAVQNVINVLSADRTIPVSYSQDDTIQTLKEKLFRDESIPVAHQRFVVEYGIGQLWKKVEPEDGDSVSKYQDAKCIRVYCKVVQS
ncbi:MAG: hypothetical protein COT84_05055 [Chlamydiae bacterium CG10_big_fil_rev_8_21_14_0_10_35_9]|nr:MAG: hypothetical protein COT84_05055 [Chlamydiae bacterium CG10_big_fil_rev_8_21_14_0_10_35_9]